MTTAPADDLVRDMRAILRAVGRRLGLQTHDATLIHLHSNAIFLLPAAGLVARIATNPDAFDRVAASVRLTRWLSGQGFPCTPPADIDGQPLLEQGRVVSLWRHLPTVHEPRPGGANLGRLLRILHDMPIPPDPPHRFTDPFASVSRAVAENADVLSPAQHRWLTDRITGLRAAWQALDFPQPPGLIHGDAHPGNLLRTTAGLLVLGDWDHTALGPPAWDLAQIHYTHRRFGRPDAADIDGFTDAYGWDIRTWPGLDTLIATREITGLSPYLRTATSKPFAARELAHRLDTLRRRDTTARWHSPSD